MNIGKDKKFAELKTIVDWKPDFAVLDQAFEEGAGNPGIQYLTGKPRHIAFYLQFAKRIIAEGIDPSNAELCKVVADEVRVQIPQGRASRHITLHLLFPDQFERIASDNHRKRITEAFSAETDGVTDQDIAPFNIRTALQNRFQCETIDFYDRDIWPLWDEQRAKPVQFWIEKTHVHGRIDREEGPYAMGSAFWSPKRGKSGADVYKFMREIRPGDVVLHLTDNEGITAAVGLT